MMSSEYLTANPFWKLSKQLEKTESLQKMFYFVNMIARKKIHRIYRSSAFLGYVTMPPQESRVLWSIMPKVRLRLKLRGIARLN